MKKIKSGAAIDSMVLTFVRIVSTLSSMLIYKMMTTCFSVTEYGLYSTAILISTTVTSFSILGFTDAVNYFYNKMHFDGEREKYVNTLFLLQMFIGIFCGFAVILGKRWICAYFGNDGVAGLLPYVAFVPLFTNLFHMLQVLFVSCKKTKIIAMRNFIIAVVKVILVGIACYMIKDVTVVLIASLVIDVFAMLYTVVYCRKNIFGLNLKNIDMRLSRELLSYSIPMAAYILTNSLTRNIDKFIIGNMGNVEELAIYTVASKELPLDMLTTSFITVLVPYITRFIANGDNKSAADAFSKYLQITYTVIWILAVGALATSKELMLILYDKKYLSGLGIFVMYLIVDMLKFANVSLIFAAKAKNKELIFYSGSALVMNWILNIVLYKAIGFSGPAVATVIVTFLLSAVMLFRSGKLLDCSVARLLNIKRGALLLAECIVCAFAVHSLGNAFIHTQNAVLRFVVMYGVYGIVVGLLNVKYVLKLLKNINNIKMC